LGFAHFRLLHCTLISLLLGGLSWSSCTPVATTGKLSGINVLEDYSWSGTAYLEPDLDLNVLASLPWTVGFEGTKTPGQDSFWLAATFLNSSPMRFDGYIRQFTPSTGWAESGSQFQAVASDTNLTYGFGAVQIASDRTGGVLAVFFTMDIVSGVYTVSGATSVFFDGYWGPSNTYRDYAPSEFFDFFNSANLTASSYGATLGLPHDLWLSSDYPGQGAYFGAQGDISPVLSGIYWSRSGGLASTHAVCSKSMLSTLTSRASGLQVQDDGLGSLCIFTEDSEQIQAHCVDTGDLQANAFYSDSALEEVFTPPMSSGEDASISGVNPAALVASATDQQGTVLTLFWRESDEGGYQLVARERVAGAWSEDLILVATLDSLNYTSAMEEGFPIPPALTALSAGRFLAVWQAYDVAAGLAVLYYSVRDTEGAWTRARSMGLDIIHDPAGEIGAASRSSVDGLWLFSNGAGEAAFAMRYLGSDAAAADITEVPRRWVFSRYSDSESAWGEFVARARPDYEDVEEVGCTPDDLKSTINHCSHPPSGAVFSDGSAVIVFPTEDNEGRARLGTVVFQ